MSKHKRLQLSTRLVHVYNQRCQTFRKCGLGKPSFRKDHPSGSEGLLTD